MNLEPTFVKVVGFRLELNGERGTVNGAHWHFVPLMVHGSWFMAKLDFDPDFDYDYDYDDSSSQP